MTALTLLQKCYGPRYSNYLRVFETKLSSQIQGLEAQVKVTGRSAENWIKVRASGPDVQVVIHYLQKRYGLAPSALSEVALFKEYEGRVIDSGSVGYGLYLDIGVSAPRNIDALIPLHTLRSQIALGERLSLNEMVDAYQLHDNLPLKIRVTEIDSNQEEIEGRLSSHQSSKIRNWASQGLDIVMVLGTTGGEVSRALKRTGLRRYVIKVSQLGFLEHLIFCKLGTEGPGIIRKIGPLLPHTPLHFFSPKRAARILGANSH